MVELAHARRETKARIFVSYSRIDMAFVDILVHAMQVRGFTPRIDRSDIRTGEDWWRRIVDLIADCTIMVFVISPDSIASPVCRKEIDLAVRLGKRIVPLLFRQPTTTQVPTELSAVNWVPFGEFGRDFEPVAIAWKAQQQATPAEVRDRYLELAEGFASTHANSLEFAKGIEHLTEAILLEDVLWADELAKWLERALIWDGGGRSQKDETARLWSTLTGQCVAELRGHDFEVSCVAFSNDGTFAITGSHDFTTRIWDARFGMEIATLGGHNGQVESIALSQNGRRLLTCSSSRDDDSDEGVVKLWDLSRLEALLGDQGATLVASLANGRGFRTRDEASDLLMQMAPDNLYDALLSRLPPQSREHLSRREEVLSRNPPPSAFEGIGSSSSRDLQLARP